MYFNNDIISVRELVSKIYLKILLLMHGLLLLPLCVRFVEYIDSDHFSIHVIKQAYRMFMTVPQLTEYINQQG